MSGSGNIAPEHARLANLKRELARLQVQHDLAMSEFKFDEAAALQRRMAAIDDEERLLAALLPAPAPSEPQTGIVPVLARPRRRR